MTSHPGRGKYARICQGRYSEHNWYGGVCRRPGCLAKHTPIAEIPTREHLPCTLIEGVARVSPCGMCAQCYERGYTYRRIDPYQGELYYWRRFYPFQYRHTVLQLRSGVSTPPGRYARIVCEDMARYQEHVHR